LAGIEIPEALRSRAFWMLTTATALGAGSLTATVTHVAAIIGENGLPASVAAWTIAAMSLTNAGWQIALGRVLDVSQRPRIASPFLLIAILGVALVVSGRTPPTIILGGALMGIGSGTDYGLLPYCMPRYFGFRSYGVLYGWIFAITMLVTGVTPFLLDLLRVAFGSFRPVMLLVDGALVFSAILIFALGGYRFPVHTVNTDDTQSDRLAEMLTTA
jgi:MFS family permease